jgi:hemolysin activation/secretion protein
MMRRLLAVMVFVVAGAMASGAHAQDYQRIAPKVPTPETAPAITPPPPPSATGASTAKIPVVLKSLIFVAGSDHLRTAAALGSVPAGIDASQIPLLDNPGFKTELSSFLGNSFSFADLDKIRLAANNWLRSHQQPFVDITIPPQDISSGIVQVVVTEYHLGKVKVAGASHFSDDYILDTSGLKPGQTMELNQLQTDMDRLNQNPFLGVNAVFSPGDRTGVTDVTLNATEQFPIRVYAGYDNLGVPSLDLNEYNIGFNWGNAFDLGQVLSYQFTRTFNERYTSHSVSDVIPLPWHDQILIFGSYETQRPDISPLFDEVGHSGQASIRYVIELPATRSFTEDLQIGYDFKTTDNNLDFFGFNIFSGEAELDQFPLIYDGTLSDGWGQTSLQNVFVYSPGYITENNTTAAQQALVPGAQANYIYDRLLLTRTTSLPADFSAITRATLQIANHNLADSEQLGGGGVGSVRGYYTDTALGTDGILASQELRLPPISISGWTGHPQGDQAQLGVFFDYAYLKQNTVIPDSPNDVTLASAGANAHLSFLRNFDLQFDLGWRLREVATQPKNGAFGQIAITVGY